MLMSSMAKKTNPFAAEDFFSEMNKLLKNIIESEDLIQDILHEEQRWDGYVEVTISADELQAIANFSPPSQGMAPVSPDGVAELLNQKKIIQGVDWEAIYKAVFKCNTEFEPVSDVVIAAGCRSSNEVPEYIELEKLRIEKDSEKDTDNSRIDFKEKSPFMLVKKGDVIARVVEAKPGVTGITVTGQSIPYGKIRIASLKPGKNVQADGKAFTASCDGRLHHDRDGFWVNEVLEILSDVDYHTGHIKFPGDIILHGEIRDGFKVHAEGSIYCAKTMDASEVLSKKDVIVRLGIIGKNEGLLRADGLLKAKFIENCRVEVKGSVSVDVGILNSSIHTLDRVDLGPRGMIVGGIVFAQNGVTATQLGNQSGIATSIHCGADYLIAQKLEWIRDKTLELAMKLNRLMDEIKRSAPVNPGLIELRDKLQAAIRRMNDAAFGLVNGLDRNEDAEVVVRGNVYPGVYVEICHCSLTINRNLKSVRFKLNKAAGKVEVESLHGKT